MVDAYELSHRPLDDSNMIITVYDQLNEEAVAEFFIESVQNIIIIQNERYTRKLGNDIKSDIRKNVINYSRKLLKEG